jgi:polygalacturonase
MKPITTCIVVLGSLVGSDTARAEQKLDVITERPVADVRFFGAACDGTTDDTAAIRTAINKVGGGTLQFPSTHLCVISGTLELSAANRGMTLRGQEGDGS